MNLNEDNTAKPYIPNMNIGKVPNLQHIFKDNAAFIADRTSLVQSTEAIDAEFKQTDQSLSTEDTTPDYTTVKVTRAPAPPPNHRVVQEIDNFIQKNADRILESMAVETVNMDHLMPNIPINLTMSEFAEQAATVASIISNENTDAMNDELHLRESFDNVISQIQDDLSSTTTEDVPEETTIPVASTATQQPPSPSTQIWNVQAFPLVNDSSVGLTVVKKTSSVSSSSQVVTEKPVFVATTAGVFMKVSEPVKQQFQKDAVNYVKIPLVNEQFDGNTEISVQADVHEKVHSVKMKRPTTIEPTTDEPSTTHRFVEISSSNPTTQRIRDPITTIYTTETPFDDATEDRITTERPALQSVVSPDYTTESVEVSGSGSGELTENYMDDMSAYATSSEENSSEAVSVVQSDEMNDSSESFFESTVASTEQVDKVSPSSREEFISESRIISTTNEAEEFQTTTTTSRLDDMVDSESSTDSTTLEESNDNEVLATTITAKEEYTTEAPIQNDQDISQTTMIMDQITDDLSTTLMQELEQKWELLTKNRDAIGQGLKPTTPPRRDFDEIGMVMDRRNTTSSTRKEDSQEIEEDQKVAESINHIHNEEQFAALGEATNTPTKRPDATPVYTAAATASEVTKPVKADNRTAPADKPSKGPLQKIQQKIHSSEQKIYHISQSKPSIKLPPALSTLKLKVGTSTKKPIPVKLEPAPKQALGLEESTVHANEDILEFTKMCNELAFAFWRALNSEGISSARSLVISPFALNSMLAMVFLGARGGTSGEMNEMLRLDDMVTFNPHLIFHNISESSENVKDSPVATSAFVRELFSDRSKGKILAFYKEKAQQFYSGHVEEVNFNIINDIIRRRTNLLVKRHTSGKIPEYLKTNNVWANLPLAGVSSNIFQTDCSRASTVDRDGEMFFQVLPAIRQRRLVPIPAAVWPSGFTAGYDPELDATAVAFGSSSNTISTVFVMPGQQGHSAPGDNLERLESVLMINAVSKNAWRRLLTTLMERPGLEVQIPRFSHRSFINATSSLQKMGLKTIFDFDKADLRGLTGSITRDMYISDMIQINTFSTCGEEKISDQHHSEMYPAPPIRSRSMQQDDDDAAAAEAAALAAASADGSFIDFDSRAFHDPLLDLKYLELPLPLRPRQARIPEAPRLRFDKPFLYFVRHNPTGMILYMGRFNPRLLP